jgi:hypothetical protein
MPTTPASRAHSASSQASRWFWGAAASRDWRRTRPASLLRTASSMWDVVRVPRRERLPGEARRYGAWIRRRPCCASHERSPPRTSGLRGARVLPRHCLSRMAQRPPCGRYRRFTIGRICPEASQRRSGCSCPAGVCWQSSEGESPERRASRATAGQMGKQRHSASTVLPQDSSTQTCRRDR